jgi:hypothetical protein
METRVSILDRARSGQNALEQIANAVPGFRGYREKELRRDADRLQREHLASRLEECKKPLNDVAAAATRSGSLDLINDVEAARKRLDRVVARIRFADRGYAGFFDAVKVEEDTLARVYEFDLALVGEVASVVEAAPPSAADPAATRAALNELVGRIDALDARLAERDALLSGFA